MEPRQPPDAAAKIRSIERILALAARAPGLLDQATFKGLARAVQEVVPFLRLAFLLHEDGPFRRVFAFSEGPEDVIPFGTRFKVESSDRNSAEGTVTIVDDAREGTALERFAASRGHMSYVSVPVRAGPGGQVAGELVATFPEVGEARHADIAYLEIVANVLAAGLPTTLEIAHDRKLARILESSGDALIAWDMQGLVTYANGATATLLDYPHAQIIGSAIGALIHPVPDAGAATASGMRCKLQAKQREIDIDVVVAAIEGDPQVAAHARIRDISALVRAEQEAAQALLRAEALEQRHRALLDSLPLLIFRIHRENRQLVFLSRHTERMLGIPIEEALETPDFLRSIHATEEGMSELEAAIEKASLGLFSLPYEARLRRRDGGDVAVQGSVSPLLDASGEVVAIEGVLADVSMERSARTRLVQADRLSTLGMLAASVAHEINNPAAFIMLGLDVLRKLLAGEAATSAAPSEVQVPTLVSDLRDSIRRIVDITRDLRMFAVPSSGDGRRTFVDVNRTVESALTLTRGRVLERAQLVKELAEVPPVVMDEGRLGQVIVNLVVNAAQAIAHGSGSFHEVRVTTALEGRDVVIRVRDTGEGIPEDRIGRIWEPFFTTKGPDSGTGLGLPISRDIVERAGGTMHVESPAPGSSPPIGTEFTIRLPMAGSPPKERPSERERSFARGPRARVLIVEDEPNLARALVEELSALHDVDWADGGRVALGRILERDYDVVLCDLRMPGMGGEELFAKVKERKPAGEKAFVFMTGARFGPTVEAFLEQARRPILEKPFALQDAMLVIRQVTRAGRR